MGKIVLFIVVFIFYGCETQTFVREGNTKRQPLEFNFKTTKDADCGMSVDSLQFSAQIVSKDGKTWFFHDPGGVANFLAKTKINSPIIWFYTIDTKRWLDSKRIWFSTIDTTPMGYGFGAYEERKNGYIKYKEMSLRMLRGENLTNPKIRKKSTTMQ